MTLETTQQLRTALASVVVVPVTPFGPDGAPDTNGYASLETRLPDGGTTARA